MSNANRDYAIVYDVKNSSLVLSRPLVFYITDKNTSNIFVRLVTRIIIGDGIDQYTDIENATNYVLTMRVIKPNDEIKSIQAIQHEPESLFQFDLTEDFKDIPGKYICELTISNIVSGRQEFITSDPFNYEVKRSILSKVNVIEGEGTTVEKLLNDLDATKAEFSSQIKEKATKIEVEVERKRIDSLTTLTEGSTTGDAELIDGRIGANGVVYDNIGGSIRTQIKQIKKDDYNILYTTKKAKNLIVRDELIQGRYVDTNGVEQKGDEWCVTNYIYIGDMEKHYRLNTGLTCYYDENKSFISYYQAEVNDKEMIHPEGAKYIRVSVLKEYINYACVFREDLPPSKNDYGIVTDTDIYDYKPYQSGFIPFTVTINANMPVMVGTDDIALDPNTTIDVDCVLSLPTTYKPNGKPTKLLMMCHGAGKGVSGDGNWTMDPNYNNLVKAFVENGYAVFDCNGYDNTPYGYNFWGAQRGIDTWKKAYQYVVNNYNVEKTFSIYGFSMGGCTALNIAMQKFPGIKNIAISSPVINLKAIWDEGLTGGARGAMNIAYGFDVAHDTFEDIMAMNSPYEKIKTIGDKKYCFNYLPPIKVWFGSTETDQNGVNKQYAEELVEALKNAGTYAIYREVNGRGHEICYGEDKKMITEYVTWINRFS